jgi:membrane protein YdbS with pleckstrin-like domain
MPLGIFFWVLYIISLIIGFWGYYEPAQPTWYRRAGGYIVLWILVGILGWSVFGPAVR